MCRSRSQRNRKNDAPQAVAGNLEAFLWRNTPVGYADRTHDRPEACRKLAYIPQDVSLRFPLSVFEFVLLGRKPWFVWGPSPSDVALTGTVLSRLDLDALAERSLANLSGGQRQKVALARALVQETDWLLLDEPTSSLDLRHQVEVLTTVRRVATKQGKGVILSMHDINLAARYADMILLMKDGGSWLPALRRMF